MKFQTLTFLYSSSIYYPINFYYITNLFKEYFYLEKSIRKILKIIINIAFSIIILCFLFTSLFSSNLTMKLFLQKEKRTEFYIIL